MFIRINYIKCLVLFSLFLIFIHSTIKAKEGAVLFREEFNNLDNWEPLYFPKIGKHTIYTIESRDQQSYIKAESMGSASALIYKKEFNSYEFPIVRWRWKVQNIYQKGNAKTKDGDDYPVRIYIIFKYNPEKAGLWEKIKYQLVKRVYGRHPPHSTLNYIWANKAHEEKVLTSTYTERSKMILLEKGEMNIGKWQNQEVDIIKDYQMAFGHKPPAIASIAIMNDSDNTGEQSVSYIDYIEIRNR